MNGTDNSTKQHAPRPAFYAYVVVDKTTEPVTPLAVKLTRKDARKEVEFNPDADNLRVRRARVILFDN